MNTSDLSRTPAPIPGHYCEECDAPAQWAVRDMKQIGEFEGWPTWEPLGPWHYYCLEHKRKPVSVWLVEDDDD